MWNSLFMHGPSLKSIELSVPSLLSFFDLSIDDQKKIFGILSPNIQTGIKIIRAIKTNDNYEDIADFLNLNVNTVRNILRALIRGGFPVSLERRERDRRLAIYIQSKKILI
jgi:transcription initiation factor IIE alpha subunit